MKTEPTALITTPNSLSPLFQVRPLTCLALMLISFQGCTTPQEHKWLFYNLDEKDSYVYQGYSTTSKDSYADEVLTAKENVQEPAAENKEKPKQFTRLDKPTIDEDDQLHFVFYGPIPTETSCQFVETPYTQPHDSKLAPQHGMTSTNQQLQQAKSAEAQAKQLRIEREQSAQELDLKAQQLEEAAAKAKQESARGKKSRQLDEKAEIASREAKTTRQQAQAASEKLRSATEFVNLVQKQLQEVEVQIARKSVVCDLDVREKGGKKIDYTLAQKKQPVKPGDIKGEDILLKDSILVHELYRYRILAGPVFSTLQKRNKTYELRPNNAGQSVITAIPAQDHPANFALLLKVYHTKRDTLNPPSWNRWREMINPIIGINLLDKPLQNFYAGLSFEPWGGFDIIGGVHWAKTQQLVDGFSQGQATTQANGLTKERFNNGWFVGVAADIGIITTWLKSAGSEIVKAIKATP